MRASVQRSMRESSAVAWLMKRAVENKNYSEAVRYADIFLRKRPQ